MQEATESAEVSTSSDSRPNVVFPEPQSCAVSRIGLGCDGQQSVDFFSVQLRKMAFRSECSQCTFVLVFR
jgi:hypothetical protein